MAAPSKDRSGRYIDRSHFSHEKIVYFFSIIICFLQPKFVARLARLIVMNLPFRSVNAKGSRKNQFTFLGAGASPLS